MLSPRLATLLDAKLDEKCESAQVPGMAWIATNPKNSGGTCRAISRRILLAFLGLVKIE